MGNRFVDATEKTAERSRGRHLAASSTRLDHKKRKEKVVPDSGWLTMVTQVFTIIHSDVHGTI